VTLQIELGYTHHPSGPPPFPINRELKITKIVIDPAFGFFEFSGEK